MLKKNRNFRQVHKLIKKKKIDDWIINYNCVEINRQTVRILRYDVTHFDNEVIPLYQNHCLPGLDLIL